MKKLRKQPTITIAIPTCYGGESLVETAKTVYASTGVKIRQFIIEADRTPLTPSVKKALREMGVSVHWNRVEGSQFKKLKQLITKAKGDIFIFTQDDITFDARAIKEIVKAFKQSSTLTMVGARILPLAPLTMVEASLASMIRIVDAMAGYWNNGENHLAASGRCLAFRTEHLRSFRIPAQVVNGDMFLFLENSRLGGRFKRLKKSVVYIRAPQRLKDQVGPSSRYQFQQQELANYFSFDFSEQYKIPVQASLRAFAQEMFREPIATLLYVGVFAYTRLHRQSKKIVVNPVWEVDISTKAVTS